ncbi:MAG: hypothetical protein ACO1O3_07140 [Sphingobium sp.]
MPKRFPIALIAAAMLISVVPLPACAEPASDLPEALRQCAIGHALGLAAKQVGDSPERIAETALQLCYQENMEAQNAFRAERMRQDPPIDADELVAQWDVRRVALRASLVAAIKACRTASADPGRCAPS